MLWLYILLGIIALITLILFVPLKLKAEYHKDFSCKLVIGFVPITLYPKKTKDKKSKKKRKKDEAPQKPKEKKNLVKENGLPWLVGMVKKIAKLASGVLKDFFSHIIVTKLSLSIRVAGADAASTAVKYGQLCSTVYPAVGIIAGTVKCKTYGIDVSPDFSENPTTEINLVLHAKTLVMHILALILKHGFKALRLILELK